MPPKPPKPPKGAPPAAGFTDRQIGAAFYYLFTGHHADADQLTELETQVAAAITQETLT